MVHLDLEGIGNKRDVQCSAYWLIYCISYNATISNFRAPRFEMKQENPMQAVMTHDMIRLEL